MRTRGVALSVLHRIHVVAWSLLGGIFMLTEKKIERSETDSPKTGGTTQ
jgi:glucose uptake protein GlcU